ncbi:MAG: lytic transglycosylase domain-containing protein, partial [Helicobacter sp.]|nr:lytic transglycosylase domain-containing protein [Helicobacter sp.]
RLGCTFLLLICFAYAESIVPFSPKPEAQPKITLNFLRNKPKGIVRDFYIWIFLGQDISKAEADAAHKLIHRHNSQLFGKYFKKSNQTSENKTTLGRKTICQRMSLGELLKQDAQCMGYALKLSDASTLPQNKIKEIATKIAKTNPKLASQMQILASKTPLTTLLKSTPARFAEIFNGVDLSYRVKYLDQKIAPKRLESLANQNNSAFSRLLQIIIMNPNYPNLHASLAHTTKITAPDSKVLFYLGLNALKLNQKKQAIVYFERSAKKLKDPIMRDRINFWLYLATGNPAYFQKLAQSGFPSIYALYATHKLKQKQNFNIAYDVFDSKPAATSR